MDRVDAIKQAARELILEKGSSGLKMSEVARRAGVTAGSMYQYFKNSSDLIQALAAEAFEGTVAFVFSGGFRPPETPEAAVNLVQELFEKCYQMTTNDPFIMDIFFAIESDKRLSEFNIYTSRRSAEMLFELLKHLLPESEHKWFQQIILVAVHGVSNTFRLLRSMDEEERQETMEVTIYYIMAGLQLKLIQLAESTK